MWKDSQNICDEHISTVVCCDWSWGQCVEYTNKFSFVYLWILKYCFMFIGIPVWDPLACHNLHPNLNSTFSRPLWVMTSNCVAVRVMTSTQQISPTEKRLCLSKGIDIVIKGLKWAEYSLLGLHTRSCIIDYRFENLICSCLWQLKCDTASLII
jgi:hypothetical protein